MKQMEVSFPRGKPTTYSVKPISTSTGRITKKKSAVSEDDGTGTSVPKQIHNDDLFKSSHTPSSTKTGKKRKKAALTSEETDLLISEAKHVKTSGVIDALTYEMITEGMLSLGRVMKVREHEILVSLPGRTMGSVPITSISAPYTKALENLTVDGNTEDPVYGVNDLFEVGQVVSVAVVGLKKDGHSVRVTLSMSPSDLQAAYSSGTIAESMVLTGAVSSVEDHGYIMDVGITGTHAFLPKESAQAFIQNANRGRPLGIGQLIKCKVVKAKAGKGGTSKCYLTLTINPKEINRTKHTLETINNYQLLLPGMESEGTVMETHKTGVKVDFLDMVGHIHLDHMMDQWTLPGTLEIGATIYPRVLYTLPNSSNPGLTLQSRLCHKGGTLPKNTLTLGAKLNVKVARIEKRGLIVKFEDGERGFVSATRCSDKSSLTDEDIAKEFAVGSTHFCCVLEYGSLDNMYICSFQQSVLNQSVVRIDQLTAGQVVSCELKAWKSAGAVVAVGLAKGFIPKLHFGELALKNPSVKFPVGHKFKARVSRIDLTKNQMLLTAKKRLVKSEFPILSTYEESKYGIISEGVISKVTEHGLNIFTIGGLPAFIPASKTPKDSRIRLTKLFFPGQVVQFQVLSANRKENRIILSMMFDPSVLTVSPTSPKKSLKATAESKETTVKKKKSKKGSADLPADESESKPTNGVKSRKKRKTTEEDSPAKKAKTKSTATKGRKPADDEEAKPPKKKKKNALTESTCLEIPNDSFYDTSYSEKKEEDSDSDVSSVDESEATGTKEKVKKGKKAKGKKEVEADETTGNVKEEASDKTLTSVDDCERLVHASPNSSKAWTAYIDFVLQGADIENARAIAKRAIQTILFREEKERENVWKIWLNMEATHGTEESLKNTFTEALKANDPLTMYYTMAVVYERHNKPKELEQIIYTMTKKFWEEPEVWCTALDHYYKTGEFDKGREVFKSSLEKLPRTSHIIMISKTAILEMKNGDIEKGRTLLDQTLQTYPKRLDLWVMYATQLIKRGEYEMAREVFGNATRVPFVPRRMLVILKNYLQFENQHGTAENRAKVKELALKYVNSLPDASVFLKELNEGD